MKMKTETNRIFKCVILLSTVGYSYCQKPGESWITCINATRVPEYRELKSLTFLEYTGIRGCPKFYCDITGNENLLVVFLQNSTPGGSRNDYETFPVHHWQNRQLKVEFDNGVLQVRPNSTVATPFQYELPRKLFRSSLGSFTLRCTRTAPPVVNPDKSPTTAKPTITSTQITSRNKDDGPPTVVIVTVVLVTIILLALVAAAIITYFMRRKLKKMMRRKANLKSSMSSSEYGSPEFSGSSRYKSDNSASGKLGNGYKSLDILNDREDNSSNLQASASVEALTLRINPFHENPPLYVNVNESKPVSNHANNNNDDEKTTKDQSSSNIYANLSSPVNTLKPKPFVPLQLDEKQQKPSDLPSPTSSEAPLYIDPLQDCSTRAPLLTPTRKSYGSDDDSENEYAYTYMDPNIIKKQDPQQEAEVTQNIHNSTANKAVKKTPTLKPKPNVNNAKLKVEEQHNSAPVSKELLTDEYSKVNKLAKRFNADKDQQQEGTKKLLDSQVPLKAHEKPKPSKGSPQLLPKPGQPQSGAKNGYDTTTKDEAKSKSKLNEKIKLGLPPLPSNATSTVEAHKYPQVLPNSYLAAKLKPVTETNPKPTPPPPPSTKPGMIGSKPVVPNSKPTPAVISNSPKPPPKKQQPGVKTNSDVIASPSSNTNHFVKLKPVSAMTNTSNTSENISKASPTPGKKALMPPKTPFKPKVIV